MDTFTPTGRKMPRKCGGKLVVHQQNHAAIKIA
jgi:hypothetical protein